MSWTGFKKGANRTATRVLMKTGQVERTNDRDFETELSSPVPSTEEFPPYSDDEFVPSDQDEQSTAFEDLPDYATSSESDAQRSDLVDRAHSDNDEERVYYTDSEYDDEDAPQLPDYCSSRSARSSASSFEVMSELVRFTAEDYNAYAIDPRIPFWMREYMPMPWETNEHYFDLLHANPLALVSSNIDTPTTSSSQLDPNHPLRRYRTMETAANKLQKEAKGYLDSLRAMTASQMRIAETIDAFYGDAGTKDGVSRSYKQAVTDLDAETIKALDGPYRTTVLDPIQRFCSYFPDINSCITKREHKQMDYDRMRAQVKKLTDKPDKDVTKLPRAEKDEQLAKAAYDQLNDTLTTELPQLIDLRVPYLDPSFEALVKIQLRFCAEAYSRMAQVQQYLDANTRDQYAQGELDARVEEVLQEIRDLSIAGTV